MYDKEVLKLLQNIYQKNLDILNNQDEEKINFNTELYKLYKNYWLSNEKLKSVIDLIELDEKH
ncbi:hypothetical protein ASG66_17065 [Bacillus sp. Leaf406]|nr:hypothetical protein ASG66_17065 [Bacillus sp. Leaf406]